MAVPSDITKQAGLDRLYEAVAYHGQGLNVSFANAGTATFAPIDDITGYDLLRVFGVNVIGAVFTVQSSRCRRRSRSSTREHR
jgi:NAD(P)-dependent dehydrogenase (short-subunit alcohol dehydrogenase family)